MVGHYLVVHVGGMAEGENGPGVCVLGGGHAQESDGSGGQGNVLGRGMVWVGVGSVRGWGNG